MAKRHYGLNYQPGEKLKLQTYYETNSVKSTAPPAFGSNSSYDADTKTRGLDVSYLPNNIWSLTGNMLLQSKQDSRPGYNNEAWDSIRLALTANPFGRITGVSFALYRQDLPNQFTGSTKTDSFSSTFGYKLSRLWVAEPSLDIIISEVTGSSRDKSDGLGILFGYDPAQTKKINGSFSYKDTRRHDTSTLSTSESTENQYIVTAGYYPRKNLAFSSKYDVRKDSVSGQTDVFSQEARYKISERFTSKLNYTRTKYDIFSSSTTKDEILFGTQYKLNKTFTAALNMKRQKFSVTPISVTDYSGTIVDFSLTANF
jgi:hypothetical protein